MRRLPPRQQAGRRWFDGVTAWRSRCLAAFSPSVTSTYDLAVQFAGFTASPCVVKEIDFDQPGTDPKVSLEVTPARRARA